MKKEILILLGGGGIKSNSKPFAFKPIIASSLALVLGMSVAVEGSTNECQTQNKHTTCTYSTFQEIKKLVGVYAFKTLTMTFNQGGKLNLPNQTVIETNDGRIDMTFKETSAKDATQTSSIEGNILANKNSLNHIVFEGNGSIKGNITAKGNVSSQKLGANAIFFKKIGNIEGNVTAQANQAGKGYNYIVFGDSNPSSRDTTPSAGESAGSSGEKSTLKGNISATAGTNQIIFKNLGSVVGNIQTHNSAYSVIGNNIITFEKDGTIKGDISGSQGENKISFNGSKGSIEGNISTRDNPYTKLAKNTITFSNEGMIKGSITSSSGENNITFKNGGKIEGDIYAKKSAYLASKITNTITFEKTGSIAGNIVADVGSNQITFKDGGSIVGNISTSVSAYGTKGNNIIIFSGANTINGAVLASYGVNSIAKEDLTNINSGGFNFSTASSSVQHQRGVSSPQGEIQSDIASKAMVGTLQITNGVSGSNGGWNNIAFRAGVGQTTPVIQKLKEVAPAESSSSKPSEQKILHFKEGSGKTLELDTAISGNANIYLDMSNVDNSFGQIPQTFLSNLVASSSSSITDTLSKTAILGHLDNIGGQQNVYIKGKGGDVGLTLGLTGNIINGNGNGGTMNIIFEDSLWTPYTLIGNNTGSLTGAGGVVTTNSSGKTNIILRKSSATSAISGAGTYVAQTTAIPVYKVNSIKGETNIVMQGNIAASSYISYTNGGSVNLIFANNNDGVADVFNANGATNAIDNKILGKTYKDGVKLALQDKTIDTGDQSESFLSKYGHYFSAHDEKSLLDVTATRILSGNSGSQTQTDTVYIKGLALGNISALDNSSTNGVTRNGTTYNYNVVLAEHSAFVGNITLQEGSVINLIMKDSSKLLTDVEHLKLKTLTLESSGYNTNEMLLDTFAQNNTIIDIATMGHALGSLKERSDFRLLEIGDAPAQVGAGGYVAIANQSQANQKGLQGSGALFRVYVNVNADQGTQASVQNREGGSQLKNSDATLGGSSGASKDGSGTYGYVYSDRIIIHEGGVTAKNTQQQKQDNKINYIQTIYDANTDINKLTYHGGGSETKGNIAVATVKTSSGIKFQGATQIQGFDEVGTELQAVENTDQYGKKQHNASEVIGTKNKGIDAKAEVTNAVAGTSDYTTYFITSVKSKGASVANQLATTTALGLNYKLFLANFNSLNKRMGELRNNDNGQGAWGRIFNGMLTTSYGLEAQSIYTTIQAGYDYAFGFVGANNYLGVALSYANSVIKPKGITDIDGYSKGIDKSTSNAVELALYNSYVEDSGWFNDTIFKFSYIMSSLNMSGQNSEYSTSNYGLVFSDELGYRFKLGNDKEWYIDPQLELSFGYFNQSDLKQVLSEASLTGIQDAILNLRTRLGVNWAYDFKRFTQGKDIKASIYLGTYYAYDYVEGGDISLITNLGKGTNLKALASTGRFELNIGTNIEIKDNTRIYFDFERSFGGDITTEYQVNLGVRYSFGESHGYTPVSAQTTKLERAPIKVEEVKEENAKTKDQPEAITQ